MLCDNCKKRNATVRYEENINGEKRKINLCELCSKNLDLLNMNFVDNMIFPFLDEISYIDSNSHIEEKCPKCGYSFSDYINTGLLGCNYCYTTFENKLNSILKKLHGTDRHVINKKMNINIDSTNKLDKLKLELKQAIKDEKYEDAIILRDKIKEIEKRGDN